jgi:succinate dehydrogenase flavin-adding protein (antitoxin of CptAB toxin-antitoxin module)
MHDIHAAPDSLLSRMTSVRSPKADEEVAAQEEPEPEDEVEPEQESPKADTRLTSRSTERGSRELDTATLMLIQQELADCSPAEREKWTSYLQTLDPDDVAHALTARRMATAAAKSAGSAGHSDAQTREPTYGDGHSPLPNSPNSPRLNFESMDGGSGFAATASGPGSALNAPEPRISPESALGVSPFSRQADRAPSMPTVQTGYGGSLTGPDGRFATTAAFPQSEQSPGAMPAINPNTPGEVPVASTAFTPGYVVPTPGLDVSAPPMAAPTGPANPAQAATTLQGAYWQDALQKLTALVEAEVAATHPGLSDVERVEFTKKQVWLRMLYLMAEQPERAQAAIPGLDPAEQEFWTAVFWAVSNYFDTRSLRDTPERAAVTLEQLDYAQDRLERLAALQLKNVNFCYKINSFGNFESWQRDEFRPGQPVLLYAEVSNFESRPQSDGRFMTRLKSFIEIRRGDVDGPVIENNALKPTEDVCRSIRKDYFHSYTIDLPQTLTPGPYTLVLRVEDEFSGKTAVQPIRFLIR